MSRAWPVRNLSADAPLDANARKIIDVRVAEFFSHTSHVEDAPLSEASEALHDLRIAAKRLRYTLELFDDLLGKRGKVQIKRIKAIQDELGELHNHDVQITLIEDELHALTAEEIAQAATAVPPSTSRNDPRPGLLALLVREHDGRRQRHAAFVDLWHRFAGEGFEQDLRALSSPGPKRRKRTTSTNGKYAS
jgi:CHAD domain-containing protein